MRYAKLALILLALLGLSASQAYASTLIIAPNYNTATVNTASPHATPISSDSNAAIIESTINSAIQVYESHFTNPITVNINFQEDQTIGLGSSQTYYAPISYTSFRSSLFYTKTLGTDSTTFEAEIPNQTNNPVNGNANVNVTTANLRAIGLNYIPPTGQPDSIITLRTGGMNLSPSGAQDGSKYSLFAVVSHEIDEALGFGSALNGVNNGDPTPTGAISPEDLFRYSANGTRSFTTTAGAAAYFSEDQGATNLVNFNQTAGGDFSDWKSQAGSPKVQDAFGTLGSTPTLGVELTGLRDIGYNSISAAPEPSQLAGLGFAAFGAVGLILRARKCKAVEQSE